MHGAHVHVRRISLEVSTHMHMNVNPSASPAAAISISITSDDSFEFRLSRDRSIASMHRAGRVIDVDGELKRLHPLEFLLAWQVELMMRSSRRQQRTAAAADRESWSTERGGRWRDVNCWSVTRGDGGVKQQSRSVQSWMAIRPPCPSHNAILSLCHSCGFLRSTLRVLSDMECVGRGGCAFDHCA